MPTKSNPHIQRDMSDGTHPAFLFLQAETAAELMISDPVSIDDDATLMEAVALMLDRRFSALPVTDHATGALVGVCSHTDLVRYLRENDASVKEEQLTNGEEEALGGELAVGFHTVSAASTTVGAIMTPIVFAVSPEAAASSVVDRMLKEHIHRVFVVDDRDKLIGIITTFDVLKGLR